MIKRTEAEIMVNWKGDILHPVVSVCTITYNHEKYISEALNSFLMQETDFPFEIIIDDDCSPDNTIEIIMKYQKKFPNIIKANLRQKNIGAIQNFFSNIQRGNGKYIALCEGDDYWTDPLKLQKQVEFLDGNDEVIMTFENAMIYIYDKQFKIVKEQLFNNNCQISCTRQCFKERHCSIRDLDNSRSFDFA